MDLVAANLGSQPLVTEAALVESNCCQDEKDEAPAVI